MKPDSVPRRRFFQHSAAVAIPVVLAARELLGAAETSADSPRAGRRKLNVLCVGAHPDDPESGCAGTLARYAGLGHSVTVVYLTRGERGIPGQSLEQAAKTRSAECESACRLMGAKPLFFGQIDGATEVNRTQVEAMTKLLEGGNPDIVITHWPIDTHMDHQVASFLVIRACMALGRPPHLYFFEVNTGSQSQGFFPNTYVDVSPVLEAKKAALLAHVSQDGQGIWRQHHEMIAAWRGREAGVKAAEAFIHLNRDSQISPLPQL